MAVTDAYKSALSASEKQAEFWRELAEQERKLSAERFNRLAAIVKCSLATIQSMSNNHRAIVEKLSDNYRATIEKLSDNHRAIVEKLSDNHRAIIQILSGYFEKQTEFMSQWTSKLVEFLANGKRGDDGDLDDEKSGFPPSSRKKQKC